ncbi:MAG: glutathione S-transferase family protein [Paracoccaceae bacterium]|jgi:glutathione S-transferase|nr:MAG: glutathione S-transferase family protein [Alphaproteobacteria bacterium]
MIFYDCNTAPSPRRVRMFIQEKKLDIETKNVDLRRSEQLEDWFSAINPRNTVPVLVSKENNTFFHSLSICVYLEHEFPDINLLGRTNEEKGQILNLINDIESNLFTAIADCLRNSSKAMKNRAITGPRNFEQIPELAIRGRERVKSYFDILNQQLNGRSFLCSDRFTAADIWAFVAVDFTRAIKEPIPDCMIGLKDWYERVAKRDSAQLKL